ncbi:pheromone precursor B mating type [Gelatoporia subvermispora B]|uniref:Pheromone B mating type n=1 Tax=Ceriporiopsis subvermispora (strain B) TaxID=914234 RepID=M2R901_CERS8|nr:pheromone precursor B mating type [Gelatoporia subvermispora B]
MDAFILASPVPAEEIPTTQVPVDSEQTGGSNTSQHCIIA